MARCESSWVLDMSRGGLYFIGGVLCWMWILFSLCGLLGCLSFGVEPFITYVVCCCANKNTVVYEEIIRSSLPGWGAGVFT